MFANNDLYALLSLPRPPGSPLCSSPAPDAGSRARAAEPGSAGLGSAPQPSRAGLCCQQRSPRALPLSPGSVTIYSAPDERGDRSIFSSVQKVPIYLGAPVLSRLPVRAGSECHRAVPREGGTKTPQGRGDTQRQGPRKSQTLKEKSFSEEQELKIGRSRLFSVAWHKAQNQGCSGFAGEGWLCWKGEAAPAPGGSSSAQGQRGFCFISCVNQLGGSPPGRSVWKQRR